MAQTSVYNPKNCVITITPENGTAFNVTGLAEDMINFSKDETYFETAVGAQGDVVINERNNNLYTLTVTVQATSPQRNALMALKDQRTFFSVWVKDTLLGEKFGGSSARVKEMSEISKGSDAGDREFSFQVFDGEVVAI